MRVLLVTSWDTPCGIAEHSKCLIEAVKEADLGITLHPQAEALDPEAVRLVVTQSPRYYDAIHLNHHDALHSRWTPQHVEQLRAQGMPVVVTYHDSRERLEDCPKLAAMAAVASATVVHEPVKGLDAIYWRQGVPAPARRSAIYGGAVAAWIGDGWLDGKGLLHQGAWKAFPQQPVLGTIGFNFPWKNYDALARLTGEEGWALVLLANNATPDDAARWKALNSSILVVPEFLDQGLVLNYLAGCDATVFYYTCANTGTSGAIRQGIAARKPVLAFQGCRQFRDLQTDRLGSRAVQWFGDEGRLRTLLQTIIPLHLDPLVHALAEQDSWKRLGEKYVELYRRLCP